MMMMMIIIIIIIITRKISQGKIQSYDGATLGQKCVFLV